MDKFWQDKRLLDRKSVWLLLLVLSVIPLMFVKTPPLIDVMGHLGRYTVQLNSDAPQITRWYEHNWILIPNLGVDLLVQLFGQFMDVERATKYAVILIPPILVVGLLMVSKRVHGTVSPFLLLALPLAYNYAFIFGFINFSLSIAVAFVLFAVARDLSARLHSRKNAVVFQFIMAVLVCGLAILHIYGWAVFCILWASHVLVQEFVGRKSMFDCLWKTFLKCLFLLVPIAMVVLMSQSTMDGASNTRGWFLMAIKVSWASMIVRDSWMYWDVFYAVLIVTVLVLNIRNPKTKMDPGLTLAASLMLVFLIVLPFDFMSSSFADVRLAPVMVITALLAIGVPDRSANKKFWHQIMVLGAVVFLTRIAGNTLSFKIYDNEIQAEAALLEHVPRGAKLVSFVKRQCFGQRSWRVSRLNHLPSLALVRRQAFANNQWMAEGAHLLKVKNGLPTDPSHFIYPESCATRTLHNSSLTIPPKDFDYLWAIDVDEEDIVDESGGWQLIEKTQRSRLYHRDLSTTQ